MQDRVVALLEEALNLLKNGEPSFPKPQKRSKGNIKFMIEQETEKAYLVNIIEPIPLDQIWLPKRMVTNLNTSEGISTANLPSWLLKEKNLI